MPGPTIEEPTTKKQRTQREAEKNSPSVLIDTDTQPGTFHQDTTHTSSSPDSSSTSSPDSSSSSLGSSSASSSSASPASSNNRKREQRETHTAPLPSLRVDQAATSFINVLLTDARTAIQNERKDKAKELLQLAYATCTSLTRIYAPSTIITTLFRQIGRTMSELRDFDMAKKAFKKEADLAQDTITRAHALAHHGLVCSFLPEGIPEAIASYKQAVEIYRQGDPITVQASLMPVLTNLSRLLLYRYNFIEGKKVARQALTLCETSSVPVELKEHIRALLFCGRAHKYLGEHEAARARYQQALDRQPSEGKMPYHAELLFEQSTITRSPSEALALLTEAWGIEKQEREPDARLKVGYDLSFMRIYLALDRLTDAELAYTHYCKLKDKLTDKNSQQIELAQSLHGELLRRQGKLEEARAELGKAFIAINAQGRSDQPLPQLGRIYYLLACVERDEQNVGRARRYIQSALGVFHQYPFDADHPWLVEAKNLLSELSSTLANRSPGPSSSSGHAFASATGPTCFAPPPSSASSSAALTASGESTLTTSTETTRANAAEVLLAFSASTATP